MLSKRQLLEMICELALDLEVLEAEVEDMKKELKKSKAKTTKKTTKKK